MVCTSVCRLSTYTVEANVVYVFTVQLLDKVAGQKPQLTLLELTLLSTSVFAAASGPFIFGGKLTEFMAPTAAACKFDTVL